MAILDGGLQRIFGAAFGGVYLAGMLHRVTKTPNGKGGWTVTSADAPVRVQIDACTEIMRQSEGYTNQDVRLLVLQHGVAQEPTTDDEITVAAQRKAIRSVDADPAATHWIIRASPA